VIRRGAPTAFGRFAVGRVDDVCKFRVQAVSSHYAAKPCDYVMVNAESGPRTVTAPSAPKVGAVFAARKIDLSDHGVVIAPGLQTLGAGEAIVYRWTGLAWEIVAFEHQRGIAGGGVAPNLRPILDPTAWYVLDPINWATDQTGHGNTLTGSNGTLRAGPSLGYTCLSATKAKHAGNPVFRTAGPVSWVSLINMRGVVAHSWLVGAEDPGASYGTWWKFGVQSDGSIMYAADSGGSSDLGLLGVVPTSGWHVAGGTRAADGTVSSYVDGERQPGTFAARVATGGGGAYEFVGQDNWQPASDHSVMVTACRVGGWTDDDHALLAKALLGVPA
jgi:hypothetical protein